MKKYIPDFIKYKRRELKMTQRKLADALGVTPQHISMLESGKKFTIPKSRILEFAKVLKTDKDNIILNMLKDYKKELYDATK